MTGKAIHVGILAMMVVVAGAAVIAQDSVDEDSLFALEEMTLTDAVEGDLPVADAGDDDLLAELLAGDETVELIQDSETVSEPLDAFTLDDAVVDDLSSALETVAVEDVMVPVEVVAPVVDVAVPEIAASEASVAIVSDLELEGEADALGLSMDDPEVSIDAIPGAGVGDEDVVAVPEADDSLDDLLSELSGAGDSIDLPEDSVNTAPVEEKGARSEVVIASDEPDALGDLTPIDEVPTLVPAALEERTPPALVDLVDEPEDEGYIDDMALDDDMFKSLANEAEGDVSDGNAFPVISDARPETIEDIPAFDIDALVDETEAEFAVEPEPEAPTFEPVMMEEELVAEPSIDAPLTGKSAKIAAFDTAERLKRIAGEAHAIESIQEAEKELAQRNYLRSIGLFEEALEHLPRREDLALTRQRARDGLGGAYYLRALSMERQGELEKAKVAALTSVQFGYTRAEKVVKRIQILIDEPPPPPPPAPKNRWEEPDYVTTEQEVTEWLKRGRQAYLTGEYDRSIIAFESVLARDPENKEAIRLMRSASQKKYDRSSAELDATRSRMMSDVRDTWNPRQYGIHEAPIDEQIGRTTNKSTENVERAKILNKMAIIRVPEVDFRQANIRDVVDFLHSQSVEFDPSENPDERKGVNIILKLDQKAGSSAPAAALDPFSAPDDGFGGDATDGGDETLVTFSALDISLKEALDIVVDVAGLKYRIRGSVVIILPLNAAEGNIELRMYDVLPTAIEKIEQLSSAVAPKGRANDDFLAVGNLATGDAVDLKAFFLEMGVGWPDKSSIKYVNGIGKLVVANTLENLTTFERVLNMLNVVPYQIEIEARFVEVAQTDVDSLGLEWMLTDNWELLEKKGSEGTPLAGRERVVMNANAAGGGFTRGNRFLSSTGIGNNFIADDLLSLSGVLTNPELTVVLHALQQRGNTDVLSAPKITTQSGQLANIRVVTEYIYPTEFETEPIGGSSGNNNNNNNDGAGAVGAVVTPSSFEMREVGVILEVLPTVTPDGQMINLTLSPEVVTEPTWKNYGSSYTSYDPNGNPVVQELNMEQPFFHTRRLTTSLLIYNGATVVMGGMITEVRTDVEDKIPLLGDIPIIGRLFRSRYESSEKKNLLIFVTARLVDPSGRLLDSSRFGVDSSIAERIVSGESKAE